MSTPKIDCTNSERLNLNLKYSEGKWEGEYSKASLAMPPDHLNSQQVADPKQLWAVQFVQTAAVLAERARRYELALKSLREAEAEIQALQKESSQRFDEINRLKKCLETAQGREVKLQAEIANLKGKAAKRKGP